MLGKEICQEKKREKLRVTVKDEHFNSCSLAEEKSWEKKAGKFNDEYLVWDCVKGLREVKTFTFNLELWKNLC